jgi:hypothetical protein
MAARPQADLAATLADLLTRIREELVYNAAKGDGPYRQGMHDGLRFAEDALAAILDDWAAEVDLPVASPEGGRLDIAPEFYGANFWRARESGQST